MVFKINTDNFWIIMNDKVKEYYQYNAIHINKMSKLMKYMGLEYMQTSKSENGSSHYFEFKIKNFFVFTFIRLKHGF